MDNPHIDIYGNKTWRVEGGLHRTDGPAIEWVSGAESWYFNNNAYTFDQWLDANTDLTDGEKVMMKLAHG
jgi:hypothetical protein